MSFQGRSLDEREAASIVAGLHSTTTNIRASAVNDDRAPARASTSAAPAAGRKRRRDASSAAGKASKKKKAAAAAKKPKAKKKAPPMDATGLVFAQPELKPPPYFYYTDHSTEMDDDPLTPITAAGSVPTFPAKMHAILTNPDLADVVGWAPNGRSWRILKPRDFEIRVLPKYFEHSKFSSFVRQANGWGFRRMAQGYDKNAYYHEYFLRAMPWLCKKMRRPKVAEKKAVNPEMEPDLDAIGLLLPVPDRPITREVLVLQKTIELGPKARMPVLWDIGTPPAAPSSPAPAGMPKLGSTENLAGLANMPTMNHSASHGNLKHSASYGNLKPAALPTVPVIPRPQVQAAPTQVAAPVHQETAVNAMLNMGSVQANMHQFSEGNNVLPPNTMQMAASTQNNYSNTATPYAAAASTATQGFNQAIPTSAPQTVAAPPTAISQAPQQNSNLSSDSHFAAGFMAATAYHSNQIRNMLGSAFAAGVPIDQATNMVMQPPAAAPPPAATTMAAATPAAATTITAASLESALNLLQRAQQMSGNNLGGMGQSNLSYQAPSPHSVTAANLHVQTNPAFASVAQAVVPQANPPPVARMPQASPAVAAASGAGGNFGYGRGSMVGGQPTGQPRTLSQHAMQRLQQAQAVVPQANPGQPSTLSQHAMQRLQQFPPAPEPKTKTTLSQHAMQRLQQFHAHQSSEGDGRPQYSYPHGNL